LRGAFLRAVFFRVVFLRAVFLRAVFFLAAMGFLSDRGGGVVGFYWSSIRRVNVTAFLRHRPSAEADLASGPCR
jgi:hypothetical protein